MTTPSFFADLKSRAALGRDENLERSMGLSWDDTEPVVVPIDIGKRRMHEYRVVWTRKASEEMAPHFARVLAIWRSSTHWEASNPTPPLWKTQVAAAEQSIRTAWEQLEPRAAATSISAIWAALDDAAALAEARLRLLIGQLDAPPAGELSSETSQQLAAIATDRAALEVVVEQTRKLLSAASVVYESRDVQPEIEIAGPGKVGINWTGLGTFLRWIIEPCEMRWPGVRVKVYVPDAETPTSIRLQRFYDAASVIDHMKSIAGA